MDPLQFDQLIQRLLPQGEFQSQAQFLITSIQQDLRDAEARECEQSLYTYLQRAWRHFDPTPFIGGWHLEAIAYHLEAVSYGQIRKLLINIRPRSAKTSMVAIAWPTWTWAKAQTALHPLVGPGVRFLCGSYGANKAQVDAVTARRLIASNWYQERWGHRVQISEARDNAQQYDTTQQGSRISTGIPESTGRGGAILLLDDPSKPDDVESALVADATERAYREVWSTRMNSPHGAEVMIMQRLGDRDLSGYWLEHGGPGVVHLMIPSWYEPERHCTTYVNGHKFWTDPRTEEGESFWPQRYPPEHRRIDEALGPYAFAGQIQQAPEPRGGGIIKRAWWQLWPPPDEHDQWVRPITLDTGEVIKRTRMPPLEYVLVAVDCAYTEQEENDPSACVVWGVFQDRAGRPRVLLLHAWREWLEMRSLARLIMDTCRRPNMRADMLIIEGKASGLSAVQEVGRLCRDGEWVTKVVPAKGDKEARLMRTQPLFVDKMVYAPDRKYADMVIDEIATFPRSKYKDLVDAAAHGLNWLRDAGILRLSTEIDADPRDEGLRLDDRNANRSVAHSYGLA